MLLGDTNTTSAIGTGNVDLKFMYEWFITLKEVLHTPKLRKNIEMNLLYVRKGYATNGIFNFKVEINKTTSF